MFFIAVIGFSTDDLILHEGVEGRRVVQVELVTSAEPLNETVSMGDLDVTVTLTHAAPYATLGRPHKKYIYMYVIKTFLILIG